MVSKFTNCTLLRHGAWVEDDLWVQDGRIIDAKAQFFGGQLPVSRVVDCKGLRLCPSFVDVQLNGAFGVDFSSCPPAELAAAVDTVARRLVGYGVTAFCPTLITSAPATYAQRLPLIRRRPGSVEHGAAVLGAHLEGPFIALGKRGAHPPALVRAFDGSLPGASPAGAPSRPTAAASAGPGEPRPGVGELEACYHDLSHTSIVTLAPELPAAVGVIADLQQRGVVVSMGHTQADVTDGAAAMRAGASMITHLFNAMTAFHHRDPGIVGLLASASLADQALEKLRLRAASSGAEQAAATASYNTPCSLYYGLIVDGFHTHDAALRIAHATHPRGCMLVTDAIAALGLAPGSHTLGTRDVHLSEDNKATIAGTDTLAGSAAPMDHCIRRFSEIAGVCAALEAASLHPAQALGIHDRKGTLAAGADADLVLLDDALVVQATFIGGRVAWQAEGHAFGP